MGSDVLEVSRLKKIFYNNKTEIRAVNDVSFKIYEGECLGLIGESGSGKSTVANLVAGLENVTDGDIYFLRTLLPKRFCAKGQKMRKQMQMVFQNPIMSFNPRMNVLDCVCEGLRYRIKMERNEMNQKAYEILDMVGLKREYAERYARELSGGECQRVAIARAIIIRPKLLICDEVTSSLDVSTQAQIIKLLLNLKEELNMAYLFISHDIALVSSICDRVAVMNNGKIVEIGSTDDVIHHAKDPYTKLLISSILSVN